MQIVNCLQCSRPLQKKGSAQLCKLCLEEEQKLYEFYYQRLSRKLHHLNFRFIAKRAHLDETRLETTLVYRLGAGHHTLEGWRRGICNVCYRQMNNPESPEPVCPRCLDHVLNMVQTQEAAILPEFRQQHTEALKDSNPSSSTTSRTSSYGIADKVEPQLERPQPTPEAQSAINPESYEAALEKIRRYEAKFGALENSEAPTAFRPLPPDPSPENTATELSDNRVDCEDILKILNQDDSQITLDSEELKLLENAHLLMEGDTPARRFGFKSR